MATDQEKINKLMLKRRVPLTRLQEIYKYGMNSTADPFYKQNFLARAEFVDAIHGEFQEYHNQIISLISNDAEFIIQDKDRELADKYLYGTKGKKLELSYTNTNSTVTREHESTSGTKLPKISVPTFDGNLKLWPAFFDLYNSLIHTKTNLTKVEKFHYLMTSLKNEPFNLVKAIPMTENNYQIAYDTLVGRYQNKRFLATTYFNEIYAAQQLQRPSFKDLRRMLDTFSENLAALKALNFNTDSWDFLVFNILLQKLDSKTRTDFELEHSTTEMPTYEILFNFLDNHCKALESVQYMMPSTSNKLKTLSISSSNTGSQYSKKLHIPSAYLNTVDETQNTNSNFKCILCTAAHGLYRCQLFLAKTPNERLAFIRQNNFCTNCIRSRHSVGRCNSSSNCKICQLRHHTLLHLNSNKINNTHPSTSPNETISNVNTILQPTATENTVQAQNINLSSQSLQCNTCTTPVRQTTVLLSTAEVDIQDIHGGFRKVRVLFDTASMASFITENCVNRLGLRRRHFPVPIEGVNNLISSSNNGITQCLLKPVGKSEPTFTFEAIILQKICSDQPKMAINTNHWSYIHNLPLADSRFHSPGPVDILIGAELVPFMLGSGRIFGEPGQPVAIETVFGWILQGRTNCSSQNQSLLSCHVSFEPQMDLLLQKFWEIEQAPVHNNSLSPDDIKCETIYQNSVYRDNSGRFVVPLPFKHAEPDFGDSYTQALRRFIYLESRLYKNPELQASYSGFIKEYLQKKYISEVCFSDYQSTSAFYLPHHCVFKPESTSTKLRIVFDASAKSAKGISLNDTLFSGPKLHQDLSTILLRFRIFPFVFVCDIKQMYCQILVKPDHRKFQRFLWRFSTHEKIKEYTLDRVTFGVSSAPYLALRTLKELAILEQDNHPQASKVLQDSVYIDDCVSGAHSIEAALHLQNELTTLLKKGGFELRKWASNHSAILAAVPNMDTQMPLIFNSEGPNFIKVLGLQWNPVLDVFSYSFTPLESKCTKRSILSEVARIFDPLGFLAPTVLLAKHILQQLWLSKIEWDDIPPKEIIEIWERFKFELSEISKFSLPRLLISATVARLEIHGFCDASTIGYGCIIYFRYITSNRQVKINLISAKSKVAPLKVVSLPRLELCSAYLLADLLNFVKESYSEYLTFDSIYAWSDSQVALAWLSASPHRWKTFVANRVAHIQEIISPSSWRYVPSENNPADCASRGLTPLQLLEHRLWWDGPDFLLQNVETWPKQPSILLNLLPEAAQEEKQVGLHVSVEALSPLSTLLLKFSSLKKVLHILAYILRFICIIKREQTPNSRLLTPTENQKALQVLVKEVQKDCFSDIILACQRNVSLPKPFRKLAPYIDDAGILRVGGRLKKSALSFDAKHQMLLPKNHTLTDLIIEQVHQENFHPGLKTMHNLVIQNFWIISPRSAIYRCLSKCIRCFRSKPKSYTPLMADLPAFRISQVKAFSHVSLDYAGPFKITMGKHRGAKTSKAYICLFVCCATKALHLELSSDLTADVFLASFRRFVARRGRVSDIYSDQGTNFVGANNQLLALSEAAATELSIKWHFNPPASPHFNGLSEAGVKSVKTHLFRVVGEQIMTYEEFYTLITQIEALLNSRPLSPISEDPNDLTPLTPGHFLTMEPVTNFPEPDVSNIPLTRVTRWQMLQRMHTDFWKRWSQEYLHTLQERCKWTKSLPNIKINMLVLIKNELKPPREWALGRVIKLHPGEDEVIRVVTLKTKSGILQRPVVKLCPLPGQ